MGWVDETEGVGRRDIFGLTRMAKRDILNCAFELLKVELHTELIIFIKDESNYDHTSLCMFK